MLLFILRKAIRTPELENGSFFATNPITKKTDFGKYISFPEFTLTSSQTIKVPDG
jgi:hypothetical protein